MSELFEQIRASCREVTRRARHVRLDEDALERFAERLARERWPEDELDPAHHFAGPDAERLAFVFALDAINFGSGWFPLLRKPPGMSGYRTIATACKEAFETRGSPSPDELRQTSSDSMAELLGQDARDPQVMDLMSLFAQAWRDLGRWLGARFDDSFEAVLQASAHSAERLVGLLAEMPLYRDLSPYEELVVPFYKRAQITAADLHRAFGSGGRGRFDDLDRLTLSDNLVPHVLRCHGVLVHSEVLARRIDSGDLLVVGSLEEVEIRAVAVDAVERLVAALGVRGLVTTAHALDALLWNAGQAPEIKARPRHRARSSFY